MLVVMQADATPRQIDDVCAAIRAMGFEPVPMPGAQRTAVGLIGNDGQVDGSHIAGMGGVAQVLYVSKPYKQVSREWRPENTVVEVAPGVRFGGPEVPVIAGPCSVESEAQILASAHAVKAAGAVALPRRRVQAAVVAVRVPGARPRGARAARQGARGHRARIVTEALDEEGAHAVAEYADVCRSARATCRTSRCSSSSGG
jgi:3-deoxy-7-phosphoheptulonate synthase